MSASKHTPTPKHFGLVGHPLAHSLSPFIHDGIMEALEIPGDYRLIDVSTEALADSFPQLAALDGFNITIPHKELFYQMAPQHDPLCHTLGAANTIHNGKAYNTDIYGLARMPIHYDGRHVLILGAGGTSRMMAHHAAREGAAQVTFIARNQTRTEQLIHELQANYPNIPFTQITHPAFTDLVWGRDATFQVILNGTPVGMWPKMGALPLPERAYKRLLAKGTVEAVFDAIYNPTATRLVLIARSHRIPAYGGASMLFGQALAAQAIWAGNPPTADVKAFSPLLEVRKKLTAVEQQLCTAIATKSPIKWVLTGFMGSGKTRMAKRLARVLPFPVTVYDLDKVIVRKIGMSIEDYFAEFGEPAFREIERQTLVELLQKTHHLIISTGGGTIVQKGAARSIHDAHGTIINLRVSLETALARIGDGRGRPLAQGPDARAKIEQLFEARSPIYRLTADYIVNANRYPQRVAVQILDAFDLKPKPANPSKKPHHKPGRLSSSHPKHHS